MTGLSVAQTARELRERFNENEIRQLIQELMSYDVVVSETPGSSSTSRLESKRVALSEFCTCSCSCVPMNPALWSALPDELLVRVFALLPLAKINELHRLSEKWMLRFSSADPEYMRVCSEASPRMFAMVGRSEKFGDETGSLQVRVFDTAANRWYSSMQPMGEASMCAGDGGLVCSVSDVVISGRRDFEVRVFNPLTRKWIKLPQHGWHNLQPRMVQLVIDEDTRCYKVMLVCEEVHGAGSVTAKMYCSKTGEWSSAEAFPGLIFGCLHGWKQTDGLDGSLCLDPGAYDCARHQLHEFNVQTNLCDQVYDYDSESNSWRDMYVVNWALVKDHLFVLNVLPYCFSREYVISKYHLQVENCQPKWVKLRDFDCGNFQYGPSRTHPEMKLHACKGFLLLKAAKEENGGFEHKSTWLYDLSMTKWQKVPDIPDARIYPQHKCGNIDAMFELRWDAVP